MSALQQSGGDEAVATWSDAVAPKRKNGEQDRPTRILVADAFVVCRYGLVRALNELYGGIAIKEASNLDDTLAAIRADTDLDLVLLSLDLPGMEKFKGLRELIKRLPRTPFVVLSMTVERQDIFAALQHGARGYLPICSSMDVFRHALPLIMSGECFVPAVALRGTEQAAAPLSPGESSGGRERAGALTPRQREVLALLAAGKSNKEIARQLNLLVGTVKLHVKAILRALEASNRTQAVVAAVRAGYLSKDFLSR